ncbi:glycosyltransferase family 87 protein [Halorussus salinisoli]|uniref:glycosyltransferase family 87 protein n=1 Tax=Halorussus salinisoli TaxID=2558242 RepID=UPI0010C1C449|nr:glycosyltransferase family 87 protein [Halorussus salinisoli]
MVDAPRDPTDARAPRNSPDSRAPPNPTDARLVLAVGVLLGVVGIAATVARHPSRVGMDLQVYYFAAEAALAGADFYAASPPAHPTYGYVYPPVTLPVFLPLALFDSWRGAFAAFTLLNAAAALGVAVLLVDYVERYRDSLPWLDRGLIAAFTLLSLHSASTLLYGETNFFLLLALDAGFRWLDDGSESRAGVAVALPAVVKLFPAAVGVWFLRRRAWRTVAAATATGVGLFALGVATFGVESHLTYLRVAVAPRLSSAEFAGGLAPGATLVTLRRPLSVLLPGLDPSLYGPLAFLLLAPVVGYCYRRVSGPVERLVAIFATMAAIVIGFPSLLLYVVYLLFPMVPLLYLLERGPARKLFVAGAFVANFGLTLANVRALVGATPIPDGVLAVLTPAFTLATPPLYGVVLMLGGCVVYVRRTVLPRSTPS